MNAPSTPTIGILAGMGPRSTAPFIDLVVTECQNQYGARDDIDFPKMLICSQPAPFYEDRPVDHAALEAAILDGLHTLENAGASFLAMACNTAHIYYPRLAASVKVPLLNMIELTVAAAPTSGQRVALIAARPTAESNLYQEGLRKRGLDVVDIDWQADIDHLIGVTRTSTDPILLRKLWKGLTARAAKDRVDTLVLACLDMGAILAHLGTGFPILDASHCLAQASIKRWLDLRGPKALSASPAR